VEAALACARGVPDAATALAALIAETRVRHEELGEAIVRGRDRLLELNTEFAAGAEMLRERLAAIDADESLDEFITALFEHFGIDVDEIGTRSVRLDPEMLATDMFPGLESGPRQATFDRATALARDDLLFLRADHPMVAGAMDLLLSSEAGNAAFLLDDTLPPRSALLEAIFVLECVAPPALAVERFLPPQPLRVVVDSRRTERTGFVPDARSVAKAPDRQVDLSRYRKVLAQLVPALFEAARGIAGRRGVERAAEALARAEETLAAEIERLEALARVNPGVRPQEIAAAREELESLRKLLPESRVRLDALRLVVSADFLALRA
jgi:ATP-dependent helicase HepA